MSPSLPEPEGLLPPAGWYPDPSDDFEQRWWDGTDWTEHVCTGRFTGTSRLIQDPIPEEEALVWWGEDPRVRFTTHRAVVLEGQREVVLSWWMVVTAEARPSTRTLTPGYGDVCLLVDYPGHTDRREWRISRVADPAYVAAVARMWARRHRRAAGYP